MCLPCGCRSRRGRQRRHPFGAPAAPASAGTDPLVPYGTDPHSPYVFGYHVSDHDEANTTNGQVDVPF
jgi:hypothetical protein